jgi:transcriptional regulator with PAS, ATPase and Fis domain
VQITEPATFQVFLGMPAVIGSTAMRSVFQLVERVSKTSAAVLITGESGSGKELVARAIHHYSLRCAKPWVDISCAALPEHLVESELFGYDKGAFSGADSAKPGLFELAHSGTLFLDEIGELDPKMQVKLLRVLDSTPYYRLGGTKKTTVDVRVIAATNVNLEQAMQAGRFRRDLYHRLSQIQVAVPPLRERVEDIEPIARFFLNQHNPALSFSSGALDALRWYGWPGNVRELRNVVIRAAVLAEEAVLCVRDLPAEIQGVSPSQGDRDCLSLEDMERRTIMSVLSQTQGHHERAAALLGISRRTLSRKLKMYEMQACSPVM